MGKKPRIDPNSTFVLDDQDVEELDELTLTTVIRDASESTHQEHEKDQEPPTALDDFDFRVLAPDDLENASEEEDIAEVPPKSDSTKK